MCTAHLPRFAFALAATLASAALAQALDIYVRSDRDQVRPGEAVNVIVEVRNVQGHPSIDLPQSPDCTIHPVGSERATPSLLRGVAVKGSTPARGPGQGL